MRQSPSASVELLTLVKRLNDDVADNDNNDDHRATSISETSENESTNNLLKRMCEQLREIRDVLHARVSSEQEQRCEDDKENEMKNDWMLAAAVLDRICAVAITAIFIVGTVLIFVVSIMHP